MEYNIGLFMIKMLNVLMLVLLNLSFVSSDLQTSDYFLRCGKGKKPTYEPYEVYDHIHLQQCLRVCDSNCAAVTFVPDFAQKRAGRGQCLLYTKFVSTDCSDMVNNETNRYYEKRGAVPVFCLNGGSWNGVGCSCVPIWVGTYCQRLAGDCSEIYDNHISERGEKWTIYEILPTGWSQPFPVWCYMNWGGYTYLLHRPWHTCAINFNTTWADYRNGFGDLTSFNCDFWLGLEKMHAITSQKKYLLDVTIRLQKPSLLTSVSQDYVQAYFHNFWIDRESNLYKIHMESHTDNQALNNAAGDSLFLNQNLQESVVGLPFSTYDSDNDKSASNCAKLYGAGWWFNYCTVGYLTGPMVTTSNGLRNKAEVSTFWKYDLDDYVIKSVDMKIKHVV